MRRFLPLAALVAGACGEPPPPPRPEPKTPAPAPVPVSASEPPTAQARSVPSGEDPAAVLRRYYDLLAAGDYGAAWAMRGGRRGDEGRFAEAFARYRSYRATVGAASEPVEADGWLYVEVPVMTYGRMEDGTPAASSGSVTLRRAAGAPGASAAERRWHIFGG